MPRFTAGASALIVVICGALAAAPVAQGDPAPLLRVEGPRTTLDPGTAYVTGTEALPAATETGCTATPKFHRVEGATALGLLGSAFETRPLLQPLGITEDEFGLRVCRIDAFVERDVPFSGWLYRVNHKSPPVGAALRKVGGDDEVLWFFANYGANLNTGDELVLAAPPRARPGVLEVRVFAYSFDGTRAAAPDGTRVTGGTKVARTQDGVARVNLAEGDFLLRAVHPPDIASRAMSVCVRPEVGACPARRGRMIVGTRRSDRISGSPGPDVIRARRGADRISARAGGPDVIACGPGRDTVVVSPNDSPRDSCEVKIRR